MNTSAYSKRRKKRCLSLMLMSKLSWKSEEYRLKYEDSVVKASKVYTELELLTVQKGVRKCALIGAIHPKNIDQFDLEMNQRGLLYVPISKDSVSRGGEFSHISSRPKEGDDFTYRMCVGRSLDDILELIKYYEDRDDIGVGRMLGYPECCAK